MPIDFARVPPLVVVPGPPRVSTLLWAMLLIVVMCLGSSLAIFLWPAGRPADTAWFWLCVLGYPALVWVFLLCSYLGYSYARRSGAMAHNVTSACEEEKCHRLASKPLVILGHGWCYSAYDKENSVEHLVTGGVRMFPRPSRAVPGLDVNARWLEIPGMTFHAGNELTEHARHLAVCDWLAERLVGCVSAGLAALPARTALHVDLTLQSTVNLSHVHIRLQDLLRAEAPMLRLTVNAGNDPLSLFETDAWHDRLDPRDAQMLVAIGLRNAVSERLQDGAAEAGIALLLARPGVARSAATDVLHLHRPAIGPAGDVGKTLGLAARWGWTESRRLTTVWASGLAEKLARAVRSSIPSGGQTQWVDLEATVGNCAGAGGWLATALAAEHARHTGEAQLVLTQEGDDMIALVCRTQT